MAHIVSGKVTVASAGTAVAIARNPKRAIALKIQSQSDVLMYVGDSTVDSTTGWELDVPVDVVSRNHEMEWPIPPGHSIMLSDVYVDAASGSSKVVSFIATLE
jgi:hypothetical protein